LSRSEPKLRSRLLIGAIAGLAGALVLAATVDGLQRRRRPNRRHRQTPREIIDSTAPPPGDKEAVDAAAAGHLAYGAAAGSLIAAANPRIGLVMGALAGIGAWVASNLGLPPQRGVLKPATQDSRRRNALMLGVHIAWGAVSALAMRELLRARDLMLASTEEESAARKAERR
jgi:hypothetical protein